MAYLTAQGGEIMAERIQGKVRTLAENALTEDEIQPNVFYAIIPTPPEPEDPDIEVNDFQTGDIIFWNGERGLKERYTLDDIRAENFPSYNAENFCPIGIIFIPTSHNVYGTNEACMVGLRLASTQYPDVGYTAYGNNTTYGTGMGFGGSDRITTSDHFIYLRCYSRSGNSTPPKYTLSNDTASNITTYHAADKFSYTNDSICPDPEGTFYQNPADSTSYRYAPTPYNADLSRNTTMYTTGYATGTTYANVNMQGRQLTAQILEKVSVSDWMTSATISRDNVSGSYPAACACTRYHTPGTSGVSFENNAYVFDWYLPSPGEAAYIIARCNLLFGTIITALNSWAGSAIGSTRNTGYLWTSGHVRYSSSGNIFNSYAIYCSLSSGGMLRTRRTNTAVARPVMRIGSAWEPKTQYSTPSA